MARLFLITHPEVVVDPALDVRRWQLSDAGTARMRRFVARSELDDVTAVWSSTETKAIEGAGLLAARQGLGVNVDGDLGENDRSATGFLPPSEFETMADAFFATPEASVRGWERAVDAQARVVGALTRILAAHPAGDVAVVAHGAVGSLALCHYRGEPISRSADQPFQGHYWAAALPGMVLQHGWKPIAPRD